MKFGYFTNSKVVSWKIVNQRDWYQALLTLLFMSGLILFTAALSGAAVKISGIMTGGANGIALTRISPDGKWAVYRADQDTAGVNELYSVPLDGSRGPVKLNIPIVTGDILTFKITPDSSRVIFQVATVGVTVTEMYSVPINRNINDPPAVQINGTPLAGAIDRDFLISPDSSRVIYRADQEAAGTFEIYSVLLADGTVTKLNGALVKHPVSGLTVGDVSTGFRISADSTRVVYVADQLVDQVFELFSVLLADGTVTKLNGLLVLGGDVMSGGVQISANSSRVVYLADQITEGVNELFSVPISGGGVIKLNNQLVASGDVFDDFRISPDSSRVVYRADQDTNSENELYSAPLLGGAASVKLNGPLQSQFGLGLFQISPDSNTVVYTAEENTAGVTELYSVPIAGGVASTRLNSPLVAGQRVANDFGISPDSSQVVYVADQDTVSVDELYSVPIAGGNSTKLSGPFPDADRDIANDGGGFAISPNSAQVVYRADQDTNEVRELYSVPMDRSAEPVKLNDQLVASGNVGFAQFTPDSTRVLYEARQDTDNVTELYTMTTPDFAGTNVAQLATGSPVSISQVVDVPSDASNLNFDYNFLSSLGQLVVSVTGGSEPVEVTVTPTPQQGMAQLPVGVLAGQSGLTLKFELLDTGGAASIQLNNIKFDGQFLGVFNGDFHAGVIGWTKSETGTFEVITLGTEPPPVASLDSFQCMDARKVYTPRRYRYKRYGGITQLKLHSRRHVQPESFCSPMQVNGQEISDPTAHLTCYEKKRWRFSRHFWRWWKNNKFKRYRYRPKHQELTIDNIVAEQQTVKVSMRPDALCMPSGKGEESTIPVDLDRFKCSDAYSGRLQGTEVTVNDVTYNVSRITAFCTAVDGDNNEYEGETDHLACYKLTSSDNSNYGRYDKWGHWKHRYSSEKITVNNNFGEGQKLRIGGSDTLCVPTSVLSSEIIESKTFKRDDDDDD